MDASRSRWPAALAACALLALAPPCRTQDADAPTPVDADAPRAVPALWGDVPPGEHAVGFRSTWILDAARDYDTGLSDGGRYVGDAPRAPRPVLVNLWYPAEAEDDAPRMTHGDYFAIEDVPAALVERAPRLPLLAHDLAAYARDVLVQQLFEVDEDALDADDAARFADLLGTRTACVRDALPSAGRAPVVLYHSGYGSSFEDDSVLCERLAAHGYVVLGSAYLRADGSSFNIDGSDGSQADLDELLRFAAELSFADTSHVAMAGHSGGAHATLERAARPHTALDACVVLDTTQDGNSLLDPRWKPTVDACLAHVDEVDEPLLVTTRPFGIFELLDRLVRADRDYLTFRDLDHDDFISQGMFVAEMAARRVADGAIGDSSDDRGRDAAEHAAALRRLYGDLCTTILAFLDAHLRGDGAGLEADRARWLATPLGGELPHLERVPPGVDGPEPYDVRTIADGPLPTPRQFRRVIDGYGTDVALDVLRVAKAREPDGPLFDIVHDTALVYEMAASGRDDDARAFGRFLHEHGSGVVSMLVAFSRVYASAERYHDFRRECVRAALLVDPDDPDAKTAWEAFAAEE